jgi:hypothetical protein
MSRERRRNPDVRRPGPDEQRVGPEDRRVAPRERRKRSRRLLQALLLPLSLLPIAAVVPVITTAYSQFDRRHASGPLDTPTVRFGAWESKRYHPLPAHPQAVPVLLYHGINDRDDGYSVSQATFARQIALLRRLGYRSLSIEQYVRFLRGDRRGLPARPVLITFDDGRLDSYRGADNVLHDYDMRATMFVIPGFVKHDDPFYANWKELRGLSAPQSRPISVPGCTLPSGSRWISTSAPRRRSRITSCRAWAVAWASSSVVPAVNCTCRST